MERSPLYFQFVSQHPRATEEVLPVQEDAQATALLSIDDGEVDEAYIGVYLQSQACLVEEILPRETLQSMGKTLFIDRQTALACIKRKAAMLACLH